MTKETFFELLTNEVKSYKEFLETDSKDWIVKGFIEPFSRELPMEYAVELNQLLKLDFGEDSIG